MKKDLRRSVLGKRDSISHEVKVSKDACIRKALFYLPEFIKAQNILLYASFRSEVDTFQIIRHSINTGKKIILPKVDRKKHRLYLYKINDLDELQPGYIGIPEPSVEGSEETGIRSVDLIIVPGAVFDVWGNRIGYGGGYYDILLSDKRMDSTVIALAYEEQIEPEIPAEPHDVKVDIIVTDKRVIRTDSTAA